MRRAGFGATRTELEAYAAKGYDATVDELLNPEEHGRERADEQMLIRLQPGALLPGGQPPMGNVNWMFHLVNTERPLEEKMALFWHHVFATGNSKVDNYDQLLVQIALFRDMGMGNYRELLVELAKKSSYDLLAGQQRESQDCGERKLGAGTSRTLQHGCGELHGS
jgi:hypothetical protein